MNVITQPTVTVIAAPQYFGTTRFPIPLDGTDIEKLGAHAAKRCYRSSGVGGRPNTENQRAVLESRHGSVFQHSTVSLDIEGITRGLSLELNRHGLAISQESTRYVDIEKHGAIVLEPFFAELWQRHVVEGDEMYFDADPESDDFGLHCDGDRDHRIVTGKEVLVCDSAEDELEVRRHARERLLLVDHVNDQLGGILSYANQVEQLLQLNPLGLKGFDLRKWARGKARNVLPTGLSTAGVWTGNMRMWRWVVELRSERHAEPEIRRLAGAIYDALYPLAPTYFSDVTVVDYDKLREFVFEFSKV